MNDQKEYMIRSPSRRAITWVSSALMDVEPVIKLELGSGVIELELSPGYLEDGFGLVDLHAAIRVGIVDDFALA
jgi:hypothetical protein